MPKLFVMAVPIFKGKEEEWKNFVAELNGDRKDDFLASTWRHGIRQRTFLQEGPEGAIVIVTLQGKDPEHSFREFIKGKDAFTTWFIAKVNSIHGIDFYNFVPQTKLMVDSGAIKEQVLYYIKN